MTLVGTYLFGSVARGDHDASSDTDVLAVYRDAPNLIQREKFHRLIKSEFETDVTIAEYSIQRLQEMFEQGHLFTWHLFQEAIPLKTSNLSPDSMLLFSQPAPYTTGVVDAERFIRLLVSIQRQLASSPGSLIHEAGLTYLALRNIAMSISARDLPKIDFTRKAPFALSTALGITAPCGVLDYIRLISARHASQRGATAPVIEHRELRKIVDRSLLWAELLIGNTNAK